MKFNLCLGKEILFWIHCNRTARDHYAGMKRNEMSNTWAHWIKLYREVRNKVQIRHCDEWPCHPTAMAKRLRKKKHEKWNLLHPLSEILWEISIWGDLKMRKIKRSSRDQEGINGRSITNTHTHTKAHKQLCSWNRCMYASGSNDSSAITEQPSPLPWYRRDRKYKHTNERTDRPWIMYPILNWRDHQSVWFIQVRVCAPLENGGQRRWDCCRSRRGCFTGLPYFWFDSFFFQKPKINQSTCLTSKLKWNSCRTKWQHCVSVRIFIHL